MSSASAPTLSAPADRQSPTKTATRLIVMWLIGGAVVMALCVGFLDFQDLSLVWSIPPAAVILVIAITALMELVYAARWRLWVKLNTDGERIAILDLWTFVLWSRLTSQVLPPPAGNLGVRAAALKSASGTSVARAACTVAVDPLLDLYQFLLVVPVTVAMLAGFLSVGQSALAVAVVLVVGAGILMALHPLVVRCVVVVQRIIHRRQANGLQTDPPQPPQLHRRTILAGYALTVIRFVLVVLRLWAVAYAVSLSALAPAFFVATGTVTQAAHMATLTPGALGILEGGWFTVLRSAGVSASAATLFVAVQRLLIWLSFVVCASIVSLVYHLQHRTRIKPPALHGMTSACR